jgi:phospholipid/cholesterol/gamma-HCH transport system substrate-binding protein
LLSVLLATIALTSCADFKGLNTFELPGTSGGGPGSYTVRAQLPDVTTLQPNSRVRVNDVPVGVVTEIKREGWHALLTMRLDGSVKLPANATATLGQTSLLGTVHVELAPPGDAAPTGRLENGSLIPLANGGIYPTTEQTLAGLSLLLNGGGIGQIQSITRELSAAFTGRADDLRSLLDQLNHFTKYVNDQTDDIVAATESLNNLVGQFAAQKPVIDKALKTIPDALKVLSDERDNLTDALDQIGKFSALAADSVNQTKDSVVSALKDLGPVLESLANAGPALTRSLDFYSTFPFPKPTLSKWLRGDYANLTAVIDLTLSRLDAGLFTGTRWEGNLTELEMQWGRTIGQMPSPYTAGNPLVAPYHTNQGP